MKVCSREDPNFNECVRDSLQTVVSRMCDGVAEFDVPPLDPFNFTLGTVSFKQGNLYGKFDVLPSTFIGNRGVKFTGVRSNLTNPRKFEMDIDFFHPSIEIEGEYATEGKIILFKMNGTGNYNLSMENVNSTWQLRGDLVEINGTQYMEIRKFGLNSNIEKFKLYASNLFTGNKEINKAILRFINKSWRILYGRLSANISETFDREMRKYVNNIFLKIPYKELFPTNSTEEVILDKNENSNSTDNSSLETSEVVATTNDMAELLDIIGDIYVTTDLPIDLSEAADLSLLEAQDGTTSEKPSLPASEINETTDSTKPPQDDKEKLGSLSSKSNGEKIVNSPNFYTNNFSSKLFDVSSDKDTAQKNETNSGKPLEEIANETTINECDSTSSDVTEIGTDKPSCSTATKLPDTPSTGLSATKDEK
ncbi:circadian clock-controlled protein daywake-like [Periplaneta americana]|uniref:circadian clock-controlled protein daywake-like n=1 Tax=Periplaneta americana TaxID=6978 RepID=UPI0037E7DAFE